MIYVEEKDFNRQMQLLSYLSSLDNFVVSAWLYPESKADTIAGIDITQSQLEPVTTYTENIVPKHTSPINSSSQVLEKLASAKSEITINCDSIALYPESSNQWQAATVGHEGMCLVRDTDLLTKLQAAGFAASKEAPSWW